MKYKIPNIKNRFNEIISNVKTIEVQTNKEKMNQVTNIILIQTFSQRIKQTYHWYDAFLVISSEDKNRLN